MCVLCVAQAFTPWCDGDVCSAVVACDCLCRAVTFNPALSRPTCEACGHEMKAGADEVRPQRLL